MELKDARLTIVGLGLIGGSMALDLKQRCRQLTGVDSDPEAVRLARQSRIKVKRLKAALASTDVLVLATPVRETLRLLQVLASEPPDVALLMDVGSTKRRIIEAMESLPDPIGAVGGHPLCGKELSGFRQAEQGLFCGSLFLLTPCARTTPASLALAEQLVRALGASPRVMEAARHDRLLAAASHLPYLVATALMQSAESYGEQDPALWDVLASGFLGTSRLAASDLTMMVDILATNQDMTLAALAEAQACLEQLQELLAEGEAGALREFLEPLRRRRLSLMGAGKSMHGA